MLFVPYVASLAISWAWETSTLIASLLCKVNARTLAAARKIESMSGRSDSVRKGRGLTSPNFPGATGNKPDEKLQTPTLQSAMLVYL